MREWLRNAIIGMGGRSVDQASSYSDALYRIRNREAFDVILCDYVLSEERNPTGSAMRVVSRDGQHLLEECRGRRLIRTSCVFIMVTGERKYERVFAAAELAPDDYLLKPLTPQTLADRLHSAYGKRQAMKKMNDLFDVGRYEECLAACRSPEPAAFAYRLDCQKLTGECLMALGRFDLAHRHYESVLVEPSSSALGKAGRRPRLFPSRPLRRIPVAARIDPHQQWGLPAGARPIGARARNARQCRDLTGDFARSAGTQPACNPSSSRSHSYGPGGP